MINREPLSPEGMLIERFTLGDANTRDNSYALYEYACHEGNYAMFNLLSGSRAEEKRLEARSTQP
jgi:hypothetical protein